MLGLLLDPVLEKRALDAQRFEVLSWSFKLADRERFRYRVEMRKGTPPWIFDFHFTGVTERWDLPGGTFLLRHDPTSSPQQRGITLYRGATVIERWGSGSRVTELVILGSDLRLPFFLRRIGRRETLGLFQDRIDTIWREARRQAGR